MEGKLVLAPAQSMTDFKVGLTSVSSASAKRLAPAAQAQKFQHFFQFKSVQMYISLIGSPDLQGRETKPLPPA